MNHPLVLLVMASGPAQGLLWAPLVLLSTQQGSRTYVMLNAYVLWPKPRQTWPKLVMIVGLYKKPKQLADTELFPP